MPDLARCGHSLAWVGLYRRDYDLATPESMAHPAKASWDLAFRILEHLEELGLLKPEATVLDPMMGTGRFLLAACAKDYKAIGVELEPKFIDMCVTYCCAGVVHCVVTERILPAEEAGWRTVRDRLNRETMEYEERTYWQRDLPERKRYKVISACRCGKPDWHPVHRVIGNREYASKKLGRELDMTIIQGDARNLSELLIERGLVAVSSPPYGNNTVQSRDDGWEGKLGGPHSQVRGKDYGDTPGQIGNLPDKPIAITSPPYGDAPVNPGNVGNTIRKAWAEGKTGPDHKQDGYSANPENIASLPDRPGAITSPPYEDSLSPSAGIDTAGRLATAKLLGKGQEVVTPIDRGKGATQRDYGPTVPGQIGQERGPTYLSEMKKVYTEVARVADILVVVVKNPTRNGKLRRLDLDTIALLEATGWKINCIHHAMLFSEQEQGHLFEGTRKQVKGRMSFFKRLQWRKGHGEIADHEAVIVAVRAA